MGHIFVKSWCLALVAWGLLGFPLAADPTLSLESAWSAHQVFPSSGLEAGVASWTSVSGWTEPGLWLGLGVGVDGAVTSAGAFGSVRPQVQTRAGVQFNLDGWGLLVPWSGAGADWGWGPVNSGPNLWLDAGLDSEVRLSGSHSLVLGAGFRSDKALELSVAVRDRTTWRLPPPPKPAAIVAPTVRPPALPSLGLEIVSGPFSPDGDGEGDELKFLAKTDSPSQIVSWEWTILAPGDVVFYQTWGRGSWPVAHLWDGKALNGELVSSATDYSIEFSITDDGGRTLVRKLGFTSDVLLLKVGDQYLIRLPSINFVANSPGLRGPGFVATLQDQNATVLQRLAEILRKFPQYSITIIGHANLVNWADPVKAAEEDRKESQPLSLQRAQSVKSALVVLGLQPGRIKVEGAGGSRPLFPFNDPVNSWKNRRVDVILDKTWSH